MATTRTERQTKRMRNDTRRARRDGSNWEEGRIEMTNQEAIESFRNANKAAELQLKAHRDIMDASEIKEMKWLIERDNLAIKALEQEPCEDAVSREAVLDIIQGWDTDFCGNITDCIRELPSVQPQTVDWDGMIAEIRSNSVGVGDYHGDGIYEMAIETEDVIEIINKYRNGERNE